MSNRSPGDFLATHVSRSKITPLNPKPLNPSPWLRLKARRSVLRKFGLSVMAQLFKLCSFAILLSASSALDGDLPALEDFLNFSGETSTQVGPVGRRCHTDGQTIRAGGDSCVLHALRAWLWYLGPAASRGDFGSKFYDNSSG